MLQNCKDNIDDYPFFAIDLDKKLSTNIGAWLFSNDYKVYNTIGEFIQAIIENETIFKKEVKLNNSHSAIVTKAKITVGCQEFSHEAIKHLYETSCVAQKS